MAETTVTKKKIADLSELLSLTPDSDFIPVTSGGVTKKGFNTKYYRQNT